MAASASEQQREEVDQVEPGNRLEPQPAIDDEDDEIGPIPIDTTAERLGRAAPRRTRGRGGSATTSAARGKQKTPAPKKPASRPSPRSRKTTRSDSGGKNES